MDPQNNDQNTTPVSDASTLQSELAHATEEMYKKNVELNERNKTLSLLRKIDVIVLSSVTDPNLVAQQVANVIVAESDFKGLVVYEMSTVNSLRPLADAYTGILETGKVFAEEIPLTLSSNAVVKSVMERKMQVVPNLSEIGVTEHGKNELKLLDASLGIQSIIAFPLIIRDNVIGAVVIMFEAKVEEATQSQKDIIERLTGVIGIAVDNALLYRAIQGANEKLKQVDKLKDEFVSLTSHELRTPMTVIKSYVWLLMEGKTGELTDQQKEYLRRTYDSTTRLINMVNDMLNISRIESGRFTINPKPMNIASLAKEVVAEMQSKSQELGIHLLVTVPQVEPPQITADSDRIKQVLINLIGNSLKFTPKDGTVSVACEQKDTSILVRVKDTGMGIRSEDMEKLFKKFNMLGGTYLTKQAGQGSGLGLYLSKNLIELHHGRIWVESEGEGRGSTFSFTLPI